MLDLGDHRIDVLQVVFGPDTKLLDYGVETAGGQPVISVLVKVTHKRPK